MAEGAVPIPDEAPTPAEMMQPIVQQMDHTLAQLGPKLLATASSLVQRADGQFVETGRPGQRPECGASWALGSGNFLVSTHLDRRIYHCRRCPHTHGLGSQGAAPAPMGAPDGEVTR